MASKTVEFPAPHVIPATQEHKYTIVLLHGRGSNGEEFFEELSEGRTSSNHSLFAALPSCKWVFPNAPERYSTVFQETMHEWFDIYSLTDPETEWERQTIGLVESIEHIRKIVLAEAQHLPADHILLGGISQGFAVASHVLASLDTTLAGFVGMSGWMPVNASPIPEHISSTDTPVFVSHSKDDPVVDVQRGQAAAQRLERLGFTVETHLYEEGEHWVNEPQGFDDLTAFLCRRLPQSTT